MTVSVQSIHLEINWNAMANVGGYEWHYYDAPQLGTTVPGVDADISSFMQGFCQEITNELVPDSYIIGSTTYTSTPLLVGVNIQVLDDCYQLSYTVQHTVGTAVWNEVIQYAPLPSQGLSLTEAFLTNLINGLREAATLGPVGTVQPAPEPITRQAI